MFNSKIMLQIAEKIISKQMDSGALSSRTEETMRSGLRWTLMAGGMTRFTKDIEADHATIF